MKKMFLIIAFFVVIVVTHAQIDESKYDEIGKIVAESIVAVMKNNQWGFINTKGEEVIPLKYDEVEDFENQKARVKLNEEYMYINTKGEMIKK